MHIIHDYEFMMQAHRGACVAIGNFDGVHKGHIAILRQLQVKAKELNVDSACLTFEPHPRQYFFPDEANFRLMNSYSRATRLQKLGIDILYELYFNQSMAEMSAKHFIQDILVKNLRVKHIFVGYDFCFGQGRKGNVASLQSYALDGYFGLTVVDLVKNDKGAVYSSSLIRKLLQQGEVRKAAHILGHRHRIEGKVNRGQQLGRRLGYATANLDLTGLLVPRYGVYAAQVEIMTGDCQGLYDAVVSIGVRPTVSQQETPLLEAHLFNFKREIYFQEISVSLIVFIRPEAYFDNHQDLIDAMDNDSTRAKNILQSEQCPQKNML